VCQRQECDARTRERALDSSAEGNPRGAVRSKRANPLEHRRLDNQGTITLLKQVQEKHGARVDATGAQGRMQRVRGETSVRPGGVEFTRLSAASLADDTSRRSYGVGCAATWPGNLADNGGRLSYEALVARAPPFASVVGERGHEWAVNQQIRQLERFTNGGVIMQNECSQRVSGVDSRVHVARFESAEQCRQTDRLTERLAADHRSSVAGLAERIQQRVEEDVDGQHRAGVKRV
jgi:hypothetical protein